MRILRFGRANALDWTRVVADNDYKHTIGWWLNGRLFGQRVNLPLVSWSLLFQLVVCGAVIGLADQAIGYPHFVWWKEMVHDVLVFCAGAWIEANSK